VGDRVCPTHCARLTASPDIAYASRFYAILPSFPYLQYINHRSAHPLPPVFQSSYTKQIPTTWQPTRNTRQWASATASSKRATTSRLLHTRLNRANMAVVRRLCRRSNPPDPHAVHPQGLRHPHHANPPHHCPQLDQFLLGLLQDMDSKQPVDDVGQHIWRNRLHATHILEAQELCKYTNTTFGISANN
jgi:hypothetical protein